MRSMENRKATHQLVARLSRALASRDEVLEAYLFGSHARGQAGPDSDIDVAVYIDRSAAEEGRWGYRAELTTDLMAALKEQLEAVTGERIAALEAVEPERAKGRDGGLETG